MEKDEYKSETEPTEQDDLKELYVSDIEEQPTDRILHIKKNQNDNVFRNVLAQLSQVMDTELILLRVERGTEYVVQIPLKYKKGLDEGKYFINHNKETGVIWPALMEIQENGRWKFVDSLPIAERKIVKGNPEHEVFADFYNIALQNQILSLSDTIEKTYKKVERIEHGQMDDRIALADSGRRQIQYALSLKNPDDRKQSILLGRKSISDAMSMIEYALKRMIEEFEPIPAGWFAQRKDEFLHKGILDERDNDFQEIQNFYAFYIEVTNLLAYSYILTGDIESVNTVYQNSINYMKTIDFGNLKTIKLIHKADDIQNLFVFHPVECIKAEHENMKNTAIDVDCMFIEATGDELIEELRYGQEIRKNIFE